MTKHTPGPWRNDIGLIMSKTKGCVAVTEWEHTLVESREEAIANANLLAASPDLLAACEIFVDVVTNSLGFSELDIAVQRAIKAIATAKGTENALSD